MVVPSGAAVVGPGAAVVGTLAAVVVEASVVAMAAVVVAAAVDGASVVAGEVSGLCVFGELVVTTDSVVGFSGFETVSDDVAEEVASDVFLSAVVAGEVGSSVARTVGVAADGASVSRGTRK